MCYLIDLLGFLNDLGRDVVKQLKDNKYKT